jgi:hypothetical protein
LLLVLLWGLFFLGKNVFFGAFDGIFFLRGEADGLCAVEAGYGLFGSEGLLCFSLDLFEVGLTEFVLMLLEVEVEVVL